MAADERRATSVVIGAATALWNRVTPARERPGWREVTIGAVFEAEDGSAAGDAAVDRATARVLRRTGPAAPTTAPT